MIRAPIVSASMTGENKGVHIRALDGLRGIAVIAVVACHAFYTSDTATFHARVFRWFGAAGHGVTLFFVLSGFLITRILLAADPERDYFKSFYARRVLRIAPLYYLAITVILLAAHSTFHKWIGYAAYLQNIFPHRIGVLPLLHFWSLAVEEQFYLVWPMVIYFCSRKTVSRLCVVLFFFSLAARALFWKTTHDVWVVQWFPLCNFDGLAAGALMAVLEPDFAKLHRALKAAALFGIIIFVATLNGGDFESGLSLTFGKTGMTLLWAGVIGLAQPNGFLANKVLMAFGKYSYGIYVWHWPLFVFIFINHQHSWTGFQTVFVFIALLALSFLTALASWHLFESRFIALKRFFPMKY